MNRHAYLIIAHNEPELLRLLVSSIDDIRNDIYVHLDKKADFNGCELKTKHSNLIVLPEHIDARWGDYSLVKAELALFKKAHGNERYAYYHLLSGVDLPIKSQDYIHDFCDVHQGMEFVGIAQNVSQRELDWRAQHWFLFARDFKSNNFIKRICRALFARIQSLIGYKRIDLQVKKGSQWCSITDSLVTYILENEVLIYKWFNHTYCPDELFIQTLCWNSAFKNNLYSISNEFDGCKRYIKWVDGKLLSITMDDMSDIRKSSRWFARKFSIVDKEVLRSVLSLAN